MSNWTHVACVIRIDDIRWEESDTPDFDELIGKECLFNSSEDVWTDLEKYPKKYLPCGSEGTLRKSVWINPDVSHIAAYTVTVFGDLRDHDSYVEIIDWFMEKCEYLEKNKLFIRNAAITAVNERNGEKVYSYRTE